MRPHELCRSCQRRRPQPCRFCGDDTEAFQRMFEAGVRAGRKQGEQDAHYATYQANLAATAQREQLEEARQHVQRWMDKG